jgi:hypothetical protein
LDDGTVRTENWADPATSPTTIAAVLTTPGTGMGNLAATEQYVDAAVANVGAGSFVSKAGDNYDWSINDWSINPAGRNPLI